MATLTVRTPSKRDRLKLRQVRQRRVWLAAPWGAHPSIGSTPQPNVSVALAGLASAQNVLIAAVDGEICAFAVFDKGDASYRWNLCWLAAGSPRVDATDEVASELWVALLEEGIRWAGEAGARRLFAFCDLESTEYRSLVEAGFTGYAQYAILRGRFKVGLREGAHIREQHESDLWSIHQLYNRTTPRSVQFAEALTSDAWATDSRSRIPFRSRKRFGFVVPTEDGIGAACHIDMGSPRPAVTVLCDYHLTHAIPSIVADSLDYASINRDVDIVLAGYQQELQHPFLTAGFAVSDEVIGAVRHTTATVVQEPVVSEFPVLSEVRPAVPIPYRGFSFAKPGERLRAGA